MVPFNTFVKNYANFLVTNVYWLVPTFPMGVLHGNRDRVEPPGPNLAKSRDPLADPMMITVMMISVIPYLYRQIYHDDEDDNKDDAKSFLNADSQTGWAIEDQVKTWTQQPVPMPPACWSTFCKSNFKQQLGCRFDIMDNDCFLCFDICNYICLDTSDHFSVLPP